MRYGGYDSALVTFAYCLICSDSGPNKSPSAVQEMQTEAAKDIETRHSEQLAWDFIRAELQKRADKASERLWHGVRPSSSASSIPVDERQEAAKLMPAGLKVQHNLLDFLIDVFRQPSCVASFMYVRTQA
jgi:hypothetical protein